jgi:MFS family permease
MGDAEPRPSLTPPSGTGPASALITSTASVVLAALPVFLLGAHAVFIREELRFSETQLGVTVSLYYFVSAIASAPSGRWAERLGARRGMALAAIGSVAAALLMATTASSWLTVTIIMQVAAVVNGLSLSASNLRLLQGISGRRGLAFGFKQASGPLATLLAGASVPAIGLTIGWRWAFVAAALAGVPLILTGVRRPSASARRVRGSRDDIDVKALRVLALATGLAVVGGSSLGAFYVESAVANGIDPGTAGTLLAFGSAVGVLGRMTWGYLSDDRWRLHFPMLTWMLALGAVAFALLGRADSVLVLAPVTVVVFSCGWGWPGIFYHAVTDRCPKAPAVASGIVATGIYGGGVGGPVVFGFITENLSYDAAWLFVGLALSGSAVFMRIGGAMLDRSAEWTMSPSPSSR